MTLQLYRYVHMLGVNGISMSGLAEILLARGIRVSGSDLNASDRTEHLKELGAKIYLGNSVENINGGDLPDLLVYTAAVSPHNPELVRAEELGVECIERAKLLGMIMADHQHSIAVAGTHGKSTTTAMIASILLAAGKDPTINIGGEFELIGGNSRVGGREIFLAEACEYTDTFLMLWPSIAVITNIEYDHVDYFPDIERLRASFMQYARQAGAAVVANADDENVRLVRERMKIMRTAQENARTQLWSGDYCGGSDCGGKNGGGGSGGGGSSGGNSCGISGDGGTIAIVPCGGCGGRGDGRGSNVRWVSFGINSQEADFTATDISYDAAGIGSFTLAPGGGGASTRVQLRVPGAHNIYNALAAAAAAITAGCTPEEAARGLNAFHGLKKRFEYKGSKDGYTIVDDYAHHPTEIRTALAAAKKFASGGRVICVFHPHTYTRTKAFLNEFAQTLRDADHVLLPDIFPAREADPGDINSSMLANEINKAGGEAIYFAGGFPDIAAWIRKHANPGDLIMTMGAGQSSSVADILLHN